jgi:hypothetical protein
MSKGNRKKHISYPSQREQCRLNKHTYEDKCGTCGQKYLMCGYPSNDPEFKKGFCKAATCTSIREIPDDIVEADQKENTVPSCNELDQKTLADSGEGIAHKGEPGDDLTDGEMNEAANESIPEDKAETG